MDPVSRRQVWNIIEKAKAGRVIVLTTHSMEEADILADRIGNSCLILFLKNLFSCSLTIFIFSYYGLWRASLYRILFEAEE